MASLHVHGDAWTTDVDDVDDDDDDSVRPSQSHPGPKTQANHLDGGHSRA